MNSRKLVEKSLNFDSPKRIPRHIWLLPWAGENYPETVRELQKTFPDDIVNAPSIYKIPLATKGDEYRVGEYIDEWGCKFNNVHDGIIGIVEEPLISSWDELENFKPPQARLTVDKEAVNDFCKSTDRFVVAGAGPRPFERLQFIRTSEQAFIDLAMQESELKELLTRIHEHYCKEVEIWAQTAVDAIFFMDDWGMQQGLLISPESFRQIFKPMYQDYVSISRQYGKYVFMHSDGNILEIIPDIIEVGVNALNSQIFCMDMRALSDRFRGKLTFWGEIDRQNFLPNGSKKDIENAVYKVYDFLYADGGVIAQCEFGPGAKPENVLTVFETWDSILISDC